MTDIEDRIVMLLKDGKERFTGEIADQVGISHTTAGKYLSVLKASGRVENYSRKPYIWWKLKEV